jgi:hypothetical protein
MRTSLTPFSIVGWVNLQSAVQHVGWNCPGLAWRTTLFRPQLPSMTHAAFHGYGLQGHGDLTAGDLSVFSIQSAGQAIRGVRVVLGIDRPDDDISARGCGSVP